MPIQVQELVFFAAYYAHEEYPSEFIDLADYPLPLCDGKAADSHPNAKLLLEKNQKAEAIIMTLPIYN